MPRISFKSFNGGEVDSSLAARYDLNKAGTFLQVAENFIPSVLGKLERRPGTLMVAELGKDTYLLPFQFNTEPENNYVLAFQEDKVEVFDANGYVKSVGGTNTADNSLIVPYPLSIIPQISYTQVGDVLYLAHIDYPFSKLTRSGEYPYEWKLEEVMLNQSIESPTITSITATCGCQYYTCGSDRYSCVYGINQTACLYYKVSAVDCNGVESLASSAYGITFRYPTDWVEGDKTTVCWSGVSGAQYYNVYRDSAGYYGLIGSVCCNVCCFADENYEPDMTTTPKEDWDPFANCNYPQTVNLHQQRLWFGGTKNAPTTIYASRTGDFESFRKSRPVQDDDPIEYLLASGSIDTITWLKSFGNLFIGTGGGEFTAKSSGAALTPEDVSISLQSAWGSKLVQPLLVGAAILHIRRNGSRVMELAYNWEADSYIGQDLTMLAPHMVEESNIRQWAFSSSPEPRIWAVREDGVLLCCTYSREQSVYAWSRHTTNGKFRSIVCLCGDEEDTIMMVVEREIGGGTRYFLEKFAPSWKSTVDIRDAIFLDCAVVVQNEGGDTTLSSDKLKYLYSASVDVLNVGAPEIGKTVQVEGEIQLEFGEIGSVVVGLPYTSIMAPMPFDTETQGGSTSGLQRAYGRVTLKLYRTVSGSYAATENSWLTTREAWQNATFYDIPIIPDNWSEPVQPFSGSVDIILPSGQNEETSLYLKQDKPLPFTVSAIIVDADFGETSK